MIWHFISLLQCVEWSLLLFKPNTFTLGSVSKIMIFLKLAIFYKYKILKFAKSSSMVLVVVLRLIYVYQCDYLDRNLQLKWISNHYEYSSVIRYHLTSHTPIESRSPGLADLKARVRHIRSLNIQLWCQSFLNKRNISYFLNFILLLEIINKPYTRTSHFAVIKTFTT